MRWYHAVIVAVGLAAGGLCSGGIYVVQRHPETTEDILRYNRFTGALDLYDAAGKAGALTKVAGWVRMPNGVDFEVARAMERVKASGQQPRP